MVVSQTHDPWVLWHGKLGHLNYNSLSLMFQKGCIANKSVSSSPCSACSLRKSKTLPFSVSTNKSTSPFELIHSDLWGPSPVLSAVEYKYFVLFIDDYTRFTWVYLLKRKSEVSHIFKYYVAMSKNQFDCDIKKLRSDSGGEYMSNDFQAFFKGILHERSCPGTPQQNGVPERKNRHILDTVRTILLESAVPPTFWDEAIRTSVFLINRQLSKNLQNESPYF